MPEKFDACVKNGGKVRTVSINATQYMHVCIPPGGGKGDSIAGEVKTKKRAERRNMK